MTKKWVPIPWEGPVPEMRRMEDVLEETRRRKEQAAAAEPEPAPKKKRRKGRKSLGVLRERRGWWHIDIQHDGIRVRRAAKTKDRDEALDLLTKMLNDIRGGTFGEAPRSLAFNDLVALLETDYKNRGLRSWKRAEVSIKRLRKAFGTLPATAITRTQVTQYMAKRKSEGAKPGTIRAECAYLKRMLRLACAEKALRSMPVFPALPTSPARQGVLTEDEVLRVIEHLEPPVNDLVLALWVTGWRDRECRLLRWSDVNMAAGTITLAGARSKTDEARVLEFTASPTLALVIKARFLARGAGSVYVFERSPGQPVKDFRGAWDKAFAAAGLERRLVHDLRRSRATHLSRRGVPEHVIMELQGWKTRAMLDRYRISTRQQVSEALERADKPRSGTIPSQNPKTTTDGSDEQSA